MSFKEVGWVLDHSPYVAAQRLIHIVLAERANEDNRWELWFSVPVIAAKANVSGRTVTRALAQMVTDGFLAVIEALPGRAVRYRFVMPTPDNLSGVTNDATPDNDDTRPLTNGAPASFLYKKLSHKKLSNDDEVAKGKGHGYRFDELWSLWPARGRYKLHKAQALERWKALSYEQKVIAWRGARRFAASQPELPPDLFRWIRDQGWLDWIAEEATDPALGPHVKDFDYSLFHGAL